jgi:hypothetical protein
MLHTQLQIVASTEGIETISVPYDHGHRWLEVLSRSAWAIDLLHGSLRHHARSLQNGQDSSTAKR